MSDSSVPSPAEEPSRLGMDSNLAGALCYLFGCLSGIILFLVENKNKKVRFHALQSTLIFSLLGIIAVVLIALSIFADLFPFRVANGLVWVIQFVVWIVMIIRTYQGQTVKIPALGDFVQEQVGRPDKQ
jgi:uncharacterized membrane protein